MIDRVEEGEVREDHVMERPNCKNSVVSKFSYWHSGSQPFLVGVRKKSGKF